MGRRCTKLRQECIYSSRARRAPKRPKAPAKKQPRTKKAPGVGATPGTRGRFPIKRRVLSHYSQYYCLKYVILYYRILLLPELVLQQYERIENRQEKFRHKYLQSDRMIWHCSCTMCSWDYTQLCFIALHTALLFLLLVKKKKKKMSLQSEEETDVLL